MVDLIKDTQFGDYQVETQIGHSHMGVVYKAVDPVSDRIVSIKTFAKKHLGTDKGRRLAHQLQHEADIIARFDHPNILAIYELNEEDGLPYVVTEYAEGQSLSAFMQSGGRLEIKEIVVIVQQILAALKYTHAHDVVHRDVNPENILLLGDDHKVKLTNFGIAASSQQASGALQPDSIGNPDYMPSEQLLHPEKRDPRADLYAVGLIMFEMLCATQNGSGQDCPPGHRLRDDAQWLQTDRLDRLIPAHFVSLIQTALQPEPDDRFQSAAQFSTAILKAYKAWLAQEPVKRPHKTKPAADSGATKMKSGPGTGKKNTGRKKSVRLDKIPFSEWDSRTMHRLETILVQFMGPFAKMLVEQGLQQHSTLKEFLIALALRIPDADEKSAFIRKAARLFEQAALARENRKNEPAQPVAHPIARVQNIKRGTMAPETLLKTQRHLARFVGPISRALVIREARRCGNRGELYRRLADYIPVTREKDEFLSHAPL